MNVKLLAFCLGDGTIDNKNRIFITHCAAQKEYIEWKQKEISSIFSCSEVTFIKNNGYNAYSIHTKTNKSNESEIKEIKHKLYSKNGKKFFSKDIVDTMDSYCFALLYMDDGSLTAKKRNGKVHAYELTISICGEKEECLNLIHKLNVLGMRFTLKFNKGHYSIRCGTKSSRKFISYISNCTPNLECFKNTKFKELITNFTSFN